MTDTVHAKLAIAGQIDVAEPEIPNANVPGRAIYHYPMALLLTFESAEDIRKAIADGTCTFEFAP